MQYLWENDFDAWMNVVDTIIENTCNLNVGDIANQPYRDWFDSGMTPGKAAREAMGAEGFNVGDEPLEFEEANSASQIRNHESVMLSRKFNICPTDPLLVMTRPNSAERTGLFAFVKHTTTHMCWRRSWSPKSTSSSGCAMSMSTVAFILEEPTQS